MAHRYVGVNVKLDGTRQVDVHDLGCQSCSDEVYQNKKYIYDFIATKS